MARPQRPQPFLDRLGLRRVVLHHDVRDLDIGLVLAEELAVLQVRVDRGLQVRRNRVGAAQVDAVGLGVAQVPQPFLRRGGRLLIMEFSSVTSEPLRAVYDAYSFNAIPALGKLVVRVPACLLTRPAALTVSVSQTGDAGPYQYLVESIRQFPPQEELADMMRAAGLSDVRYENILGGIVAVHSGFKL